MSSRPVNVQVRYGKSDYELLRDAEARAVSRTPNYVAPVPPPPDTYALWLRDQVASTRAPFVAVRPDNGRGS